MPNTGSGPTSCSSKRSPTTAKFGHRHGALHRAVVPVLQVQASSRCTARFFHKHGALHRAAVDVLQCKHLRAAPQDFHKHSVFAPHSRSNLAVAGIVTLHRKVWPPPRCLAPRSRASFAIAGIVALHRKVWPPPRCLAPRSRASFAIAGIVALHRTLHRTVWPPPRCLPPRSRASLASARIFALLHKVWPPPRCRAPRCRTSFAGASSSRCTARFGHRHGALHRAVVPVLQVQASSCCIARFFASTAPRTAQSWTSCNASIFALRHKISTSTVPCTAQSCQS